MGQKLVIGPIGKGLFTTILPFNIDNDSFPKLENAYQWRQRIKRKRGTQFLGRLTNFFEDDDAALVLDGTGTGNLLTGFGILTGPPALPNATLTPGSISITVGGLTFTDNDSDGNLFGVGTTTASAIGVSIASTQVTIEMTTQPFLVNQIVSLSGFVGSTQLNGQSGEILGTASGNRIIIALVVPSVPNYISGGTVSAPITDAGTINYSTGSFTLPLQVGGTVTAASFQYYPNIPVMGLEDLNEALTTSNLFPGTIAFNPDYAYNVVTTFPYNNYNVSYYKNPLANSDTMPGYVPKIASNITPFNWNGEDYQQFWTTNYESAFWATNGINVPYVSSDPGIGMQFAPKSSITFVSNTATTITLTITDCPLVIGDFVFFNEWTGTSGADPTTLNFQTGYVTASSTNTLTPATKTVTITLPFATLTTGGGAVFVPGIVQYLTNVSDPTVDCLKWYDGDPTNGLLPPTFNTGLGWVNFCPPLSEFVYSIGDAPQAQYYLVGARIIIPFKDRLVAMGAVIQASVGAPIYLQDTVIFSQNGTPYYSASFTGNPELATTEFDPLLTPVNQGATPNAWWEDQTGYGGFQSVGVAQPITSAFPNQDVLIVGLGNIQTRFIFTANDFQPFSFFLINSELGTSSTFSGIIMDKGILSRGSRGFVYTSQVGADRFDTQILDQNFEVSLKNNGNERFTAQRDFVNEWIYFTYPSNQVDYIYPNQTLQYNYRDESWGIFNESYTTYGQFKKVTGQTWATIGNDFPTWRSWNEPWSAGESTLLQPLVIAGNAQGFIVFRGIGTDEANSLYISNISGTGLRLITSPNHCLNNNDYITINGVLGTIGPSVNGLIFSVAGATTNTFMLNSTNTITGVYAGGGTIQRMYVPMIQTKQFPMAWDIGRKTRIGPQMYLLTKTQNSQITLQIFLSQNSVNDFTANNDGLMYSQVLYTCPESTNLGLTPYNTNLQQLNFTQQGTSQSAQMWHRVNNSLIGDTVQLGFTMSDAQMRDPNFTNQFAEIEIHGIIADVNPSQMLS
jgi:hypothetical protein